MNPSRAGFITFPKPLQLLITTAIVIFLIKSLIVFTSAQSTPGEERKFKKREYVGMPIRVRKVKNLQSETWPNDLEIEVENVSDKPIYFINAVLEFPDDPAPNGSSGILFKFGNIENMDIRKIAYTEDERLDRGEKVTLVVENIYRKGLLARQKRYPHNFKKLEFWFGSISFGDGTGFQGTQFLDLRKKSHSMNRQIKVKGLAKSQKAAAKNHCLRSVKLRTLKSSEPRASSDPRRMAAALAVPFYP